MTGRECFQILVDIFIPETSNAQRPCIYFPKFCVLKIFFSLKIHIIILCNRSFCQLSLFKVSKFVKRRSQGISALSGIVLDKKIIAITLFWPFLKEYIQWDIKKSDATFKKWKAQMHDCLIPKMRLKMLKRLGIRNTKSGY